MSTHACMCVEGKKDRGLSSEVVHVFLRVDRAASFIFDGGPRPLYRFEPAPVMPKTMCFLRPLFWKSRGKGPRPLFLKAAPVIFQGRQGRARYF